jgi:hypothetical protein
MATYSVWYDEIYTYKAYIEADSVEHLNELLDKVDVDCELELTELPKFFSKDKNYSLEIDRNTIEEVDYE